MKVARQCLFVAVLALHGGCTNVPPQEAARISVAFHAYMSIDKGTPCSQVTTLLGNNFRHEEDGAFVWETRYDSLNYTSIRIRFDSNDRVKDTKISRAWGAQHAGSQANAIVEQEK
jgi:hypothetical protein